MRKGLQSVKIYIAGPMSGMLDNNWQAFFDKEKQLRAEGWDVINPAKLDKDAGIKPNETVDEYNYESCASRDIEALAGCNGIYMLSGWQHSKGACWERALAKYWDIPRYYEIPRLDHHK